MNEDFVPFELAKKLKEKEFNWKTLESYTDKIKQKHLVSIDYDIAVVEVKDIINTYPRPTISQVLKWLRKEYFIHISTKPYICKNGILWLYEIRKFSGYMCVIITKKTGFVEEEQASLTGIEYVIDNLI